MDARKARVRFLINPRYQMKYVVMILLFGIVFTAANALAFYGYVSVNYEVLTQAVSLPEESQQLYRGELRNFTMTVATISAVFLFLLAALALVITHRTAGPMFRFKDTVDAIRRGDPSARILLRPTDEFKDVAESFNEMMDNMETSKG